MFRSVYPDASRLKELCQKLLASAKWSGDLQVLIENAVAALADFVQSRPLRAKIGRLEDELRRERDAVSCGAFQGCVNELEMKLEQARSVLETLED